MDDYDEYGEWDIAVGSARRSVSALFDLIELKYWPEDFLSRATPERRWPLGTVIVLPTGGYRYCQMR